MKIKGSKSKEYESENHESNEIGIVCPKCNDLVIGKYKDKELELDEKEECHCLKEQSLSRDEWFEMLYRLWDELEIIRIPENIELKRSDN